MTGTGFAVRPLRPADSLAELTSLLHRAYAELAAAGLNYVAAFQDEATTAERISRGECWVGIADGALAGTIVLVPPGRTHGCAWYERDDVASFQQYCVEPVLRGRGYGSMLLETIERRAARIGAAEIACDTAAPATSLIAMYEKRGYRIVDSVDWRPVTNYESVVLSKPLH